MFYYIRLKSLVILELQGIAIAVQQNTEICHSLKWRPAHSLHIYAALEQSPAEARWVRSFQLFPQARNFIKFQARVKECKLRAYQGFTSDL